MEKDFDAWNTTKKRVAFRDSSLTYFKEGDIWWCHLGKNIGQEQGGKGNDFMRPILIFKKFSRNLCWVIPLSTHVNQGSFFFPVLSESNKIRTASLHQLKLMDTKRLIEKIDRISLKEHGFIKEKIAAFLQ